MQFLDHLVHACLREQHLVEEKELPVVDTESRQPRRLRLRFGPGFLMGSPILRPGVVLFPVLRQTRL